MLITEFEINPNIKRILKILEADENTKIDITKIIEDLFPLFLTYIKPICQINENTIILTLGDNIQNKINDLFDKGQYLNALVLNSISDDYLMNMREIIIEKYFKGMNIISPGENGDICLFDEILKGCEYVKVNSSYVLSPLKSSAFILNKEDYKTHNCDNCNKECNWRK